MSVLKKRFNFVKMEDMEAQKRLIIEWLDQVESPAIISKLKLIKERHESGGDAISAEERMEIEEGLSQADQGLLKENETVKKAYRKWL